MVTTNLGEPAVTPATPIVSQSADRIAEPRGKDPALLSEYISRKSKKRKLGHVSVPCGIHRKISLLSEAMSVAEGGPFDQHHPDLRKYAQHAVTQASLGRATDLQTVNYDAKHLTTLCLAENARNPELNLHYVGPIWPLEEQEQFSLAKIRAVLARGPGRYRLILLPKRGVPPHHVMLDVRAGEGCQHTSVIMFESTRYPAYTTALLQAFKRDNIPTALVFNDVQASDADCAMFALAHALKAKNSVFVDTVHDALCTHHSARSSSLDLIYPDEDSYLVNDEKIPDTFKKHLQSKSTLRTLEAQRDTRVNSANHDVGQSLADRVHAYYATSLSPDLRTMIDASVSITGFRLQALYRTIQFLNAG